MASEGEAEDGASRGSSVARERWPASVARLAVFVAAVAVALAAQHVLTPLGASRAFADLSHERVPLGFALLLLAGVLAALAWRPCRLEGVRDPVASPPPPWALHSSLVAVGLATMLAFFDVETRWAVYPWLGGLVVLLVASRRASASHRPFPVYGSAERAALFLILVVAAVLRLWRLAEWPAQVHGDEAACGIEARRILAGEVPNLLGVGWYDIPYISFAISAAFMAVFGDDLGGLRMASAVQGVASVAVLHALIRRLHGVRAALLAAALLAVSHWHIHFSRVGTDYMQASFAVLLALFYFVRARQDGRTGDWLLAGYSLGLACTVYFAGRVAVLIVGVLLAWEWFDDRAAARRLATGVAVMAIGGLLFVAPTVAVVARQPQALTERAGSIFVLAPANLEHSAAAIGDGHGGVAAVLMMQVGNSLSAFNWRGERSEQHAHRAPLLDFVTAALFAAGAIAVTARCRRRDLRLVAVWFWSSMVLGSILTVDAMFSPRMIAALPAVLVFPALLLDGIAGSAETAFGRRGRNAAVFLVAAVLMAATAGNLHDYFVLHIERLQPAGPPTILARFVASVNDRYRAYVYGPHTLTYDTPRFLAAGADGRTFRKLDAALPLAPVPAERGAVYIVAAGWDGRDAVVEAIRGEHPDAAQSILRFADGAPAFEVWWVEPGSG